MMAPLGGAGGAYRPLLSARVNDHFRGQGCGLRIDKMAETSRRRISEKMAVFRRGSWGEELLRALTSLAELVDPAAIADPVRRAISDENQITKSRT